MLKVYETLRVNNLKNGKELHGSSIGFTLNKYPGSFSIFDSLMLLDGYISIAFFKLVNTHN